MKMIGCVARGKVIAAAGLLIGADILSLSPAIAMEIRVSKTDPAAVHSIQAALDALPAQGGTIVVAPGIYREKLNVTRNGVHIRGDGARPQDVVLVYGDAAATAGGTFRSASLEASGDDFHLDNLTVQNDYWLDSSHPPSQAVALSVIGDRAVITHVRILGHQDTLLANKGKGGRMARQYFSDCYVEGHVDFIFGNAKAYFHRCELHGLAHESVMFTAQSKNAPDEDSGYVFDDCVLTADAGAQEISLGRPWRAYASVVFLRSKIDAPIIPAGWREWTPGTTDRLRTAYYAEYRSRGRGATPGTREPFSHQLSSTEARAWSIASFFKGDVSWLPKNARQ
jgi:pectin methylesterase-like acyl-CoA thioesterase